MIRVGVIRGGASPKYYDISLKSGEHVLSCLRSDAMNKNYWPIDIFISKDGVWHANGIPTTLDVLKEKVDVIWNALHGYYGQNGQIQEQLKRYGISYTGSDSFACLLSHNRVIAKEKFAELGINTPKHILFSAYLKDLDGPLEEYARKKAREVLGLLSPPWIVKPLTNGSSMGIHTCKTFDDLIRAFRIGVEQKVSILVEEMIEGRKATMSVINNFRGKDTYPLLSSDDLSRDEKREVESLAVKIHDGMNLNHYSQIHFLVSSKNGIYAIEVDTLPELAEDSQLNKHLQLVGSSMPEFIKHIINLAVK
jgi:D-alanine-D-alanine ligase